AMAQWARETGLARESAIPPNDPLQAEVRRLLEDNPEREAQHRRSATARRADRSAVQRALGESAFENETLLLLRELTDLEARHRLEEARTRVAAFIASSTPEAQ